MIIGFYNIFRHVCLVASLSRKVDSYDSGKVCEEDCLNDLEFCNNIQWVEFCKILFLFAIVLRWFIMIYNWVHTNLLQPRNNGEHKTSVNHSCFIYLRWFAKKK